MHLLIMENELDCWIGTLFTPCLALTKPARPFLERQRIKLEPTVFKRVQ
jgi:hypothetical protein